VIVLAQTKIKPCESAAYAMAQNYETFRQAEVGHTNHINYTYTDS
jgi:hypothetical protein